MALQNIRGSASLGCLPAEILFLILRIQCPDLDGPHVWVQPCGFKRSVFANFGFWTCPKLLQGSSCQLLSTSGRSKLEKYSPHIDATSFTDPFATNSNKERSVSRQEINTALLLACQLGDIDALISLAPQRAEFLPYEGSGPTPLHYLFMFDQDEKTLDVALKALLPTNGGSREHLLDMYCSTPQILDQQLPFSLIGTPLNFAVIAGSRGAVEALLRAGASPFSFKLEAGHVMSLAPRNPLQSAVSYHQADIFSALWRSCLLQPKKRSELFNEALSPEGSLFAQLCAVSPMERWILQSNAGHINQSKMVLTLVCAIWELLKSDADGPEGRTLGKRFARQIATGLEQILALDGLEVADELLNRASEIIGLFPVLFLEDDASQNSMQALLQIACQGGVTPRRSLAFIKFGARLFAGASPSLGYRALVSSIRYHNENLFALLLIDGQHFDEVDNDGKGVLWHFVESGFSRMIPMSKVLALGLDPNVANKFGETPLHCAVRNTQRWHYSTAPCQPKPKS
ncbi:hypothetical protein BU24DRAFT_209884 [Aaosphaeria arxii CBS 175.79]|uniref:Uncharacterized protein n=1 Tax=Aaosphaeria arxii CBS 175.79 TaxID=1450172 RepID=A0A6A5XVF0_9PLEO|nr:uncharacterized protein BU24DRAFT_209884 [Aaosphaeria arxii CBS 175.79]KAF2016797.1 hypothetical protein BU24DRAFT_209884 [Aaosphaeria arxii CBS 175.79]